MEEVEVDQNISDVDEMEDKEFENSTSAEASNSESKKTEEGANKNTFKLKNAKGALIFD